MAITHVETYLGCKIYYITPPDAAQAVYSSPCIVGLYFKKSAVKKRICIGQGGTWDGTSCIFEEPEPPSVGMPTTLTINIPDKVSVGEKFYVSGILYETETGVPLGGQFINHSYNGKSLGSSITGIDGDYLKESLISESGVWTLQSEFLGTETLQASKPQTRLPLKGKHYLFLPNKPRFTLIP